MSRLPRNLATKATREPTANGRGERHSTDSMFSYQAGALSGSQANAATSSGGLVISIAVSTSIASSNLRHRPLSP